MDETEQLSLSWDSHQKSICNGLSILQQRGEFVDMTLAADGHHVKVHQMVMSLVSPYIKDLITTAQCPHPIIFLNNISYTTLCAILEYIYTGEVLVPRQRLNDLIAAGRALHIRGLREMDNQTEEAEPITANSSPPGAKSITETLRALGEKKRAAQAKEEQSTSITTPMCKIYLDDTFIDASIDASIDVSMDASIDATMDAQDSPIDKPEESTATGESAVETIETPNNGLGITDTIQEVTPERKRKTLLSQRVQYSVSNQGGLQVIHNRYIYHLRYYGKKNRKRLWRCIDYSNSLKCPANICTDERNEVTERSFTHNHVFHDSKILKKLENGVIFSGFQEAENTAIGQKKERRVPCSVPADDSSV